MDFKPNDYTQDDSNAIVLKFKENDKGVVVVRSTYTSSRDWDAISAKWANLINSDYCSVGQIKTEMLKLFAKIRNTPEDSVLGDASIAFTHKTGRGKIVNFTYTDMYIFLREALKERIASEEYKSKMKQYEAAVKLIAENKPANQVLDEAKVKAASLAAELGIETPSETTVEATKEVTAS